MKTRADVSRTVKIFITVAALVGVAGATVLITGAGLSSGPRHIRHAAVQPVLKTAPDLASFGFTLTPAPAGVSPKIDAAEATTLGEEAHVRSSGPLATVREQALVTIHAVNSSIPEGTLVWAVSIMPPRGLGTYIGPDVPKKPGMPLAQPNYVSGYYVMFFDANTGADLGAMGEGLPATAPSSAKGAS